MTAMAIGQIGEAGKLDHDLPIQTCVRLTDERLKPETIDMKWNLQPTMSGEDTSYDRAEAFLAFV